MSFLDQIKAKAGKEAYLRIEEVAEKEVALGSVVVPRWQPDSNRDHSIENPALDLFNSKVAYNSGFAPLLCQSYPHDR
jgi:hypothetical protein